MVKSDTILGRISSQQRFRWNHTFVVSAYKTSKGKLRYTDPIEGWNPTVKPSVQYRIKIYPKRYDHSS